MGALVGCDGKDKNDRVTHVRHVLVEL